MTVEPKLELVSGGEAGRESSLSTRAEFGYSSACRLASTSSLMAAIVSALLRREVHFLQLEPEHVADDEACRHVPP